MPAFFIPDFFLLKESRSLPGFGYPKQLIVPHLAVATTKQAVLQR
jgi:hypothetical protein